MCLRFGAGVCFRCGCDLPRRVLVTRRGSEFRAPRIRLSKVLGSSVLTDVTRAMDQPQSGGVHAHERRAHGFRAGGRLLQKGARGSAAEQGSQRNRRAPPPAGATRHLARSAKPARARCILCGRVWSSHPSRSRRSLQAGPLTETLVHPWWNDPLAPLHKLSPFITLILSHVGASSIIHAHSGRIWSVSVDVAYALVPHAFGLHLPLFRRYVVAARPSP